MKPAQIQNLLDKTAKELLAHVAIVGIIAVGTSDKNGKCKTYHAGRHRRAGETGEYDQRAHVEELVRDAMGASPPQEPT